jgi:hypothetical protein
MIGIRRRRGVPDIATKYDEGHQQAGNDYCQAAAFSHATFDVRRFAVPILRTGIRFPSPTGVVGGRSSFVTAVLAAGPPPGPAAPFCTG